MLKKIVRGKDWQRRIFIIGKVACHNRIKTARNGTLMLHSIFIISEGNSQCPCQNIMRNWTDANDLQELADSLPSFIGAFRLACDVEDVYRSDAGNVCFKQTLYIKVKQLSRSPCKRDARQDCIKHNIRIKQSTHQRYFSIK